MVVLAVLLFLLGTAANAAPQGRPGDPAAGRLVALRSRSACHAVAPRQSWYTQYARSFPDIAQDPTLTEAQLRDFIGRTHRMFWRGIELSPHEIADVVAYISTLRRRSSSH